MANVGTAPTGQTLIGQGNGVSPTFATIGTGSGLTNHGVILGQGTSAFVSLSPTANTGAVLQNNSGANPSYSTATYPSLAGTAGNVITSDGTNFISSVPVATNNEDYRKSLLLGGM